jgi:polyferredoxin
MDKMGYPRGLIRYSTQNAIDSKPTRIVRPRIIVYGLLLAALCAGWAWGVANRSPLIAEVLRDRNALYREVGDGRVENSYTFKLINKTVEAQRYRIRLHAGSGIVLVGGERIVPAAPEEVLTLPIVLSAPATVQGKRPIRFEVHSLDSAADESVESSFFGPMP